MDFVCLHIIEMCFFYSVAAHYRAWKQFAKEIQVCLRGGGIKRVGLQRKTV